MQLVLRYFRFTAEKTLLSPSMKALLNPGFSKADNTTEMTCVALANKQWDHVGMLLKAA